MAARHAMHDNHKAVASLLTAKAAVDVQVASNVLSKHAMQLCCRMPKATLLFIGRKNWMIAR